MPEEILDGENGNKFYEKYPLWIVLISNFVSVATYAIGAYVMFRAGIIWLILYILYIAWIEFRLLRGSCKGCYYYGKTCAFGKGKIACLITKKGESEVFSNAQITWKSLIPDMLVMIIPVIAGIVLLIINFNWVTLVMVILLLILSSAGNAIVRGSFACKYCRQRELGCPAEKLFDKSKA